MSLLFIAVTVIVPCPRLKWSLQVLLADRLGVVNRRISFLVWSHLEVLDPINLVNA